MMVVVMVVSDVLIEPSTARRPREGRGGGVVKKKDLIFTTIFAQLLKSIRRPRKAVIGDHFWTSMKLVLVVAITSYIVPSYESQKKGKNY
jgi:hypothetical protein